MLQEFRIKQNPHTKLKTDSDLSCYESRTVWC